MLYEPPCRNTRGLAIGTPNCAGGSCLWFNEGTFIGCPKATGTGPLVGPPNCEHPATPTIPANDTKLGTVFSWEFGDWTALHPWRRPGSAPVENPCGIMGGWYWPGAAGTGGYAAFGSPQGSKGTELPELLKTTTWVGGSTVEVAWGITANHGGGYTYRLCPKPKPGQNATAVLTEECFQKNVLEFVGDYSWIQFGDGMDRNNRTKFHATRTNQGTFPKGSTWTRNPVPPCNDVPRLGGHNHDCAGPMFEPPAGVFGFGPGACADGLPQDRCTPEQEASRAMSYGIVDQVKVPEDLPAGEYVLSFRWDAEQLPQIWNSCADVTIAKPGTAKGTKPFSPWTGCESCCPNTLGPCANCTSCVNDKAGPCEYCWKPLPGFRYYAEPFYQCLGYEAPDGGAGHWRPGMDPTVGWSPGCKKCWATPGSCKSSARETEDEQVIVV